MKPVRVMLFDLDGTLYLDGVPFPGAIQLIEKLRDSELDYCFVTNNSSMGTPDYCERMRNIGFPLEPRNMASSGDATVHMLRSLGVGPEIYILGTNRFKSWMAGQGFIHTTVNPKAVLVGFDRELTFAKFNEATRLVLAGVPLYASHPDQVCPPDLPDAGMILAALKASRPGVVVQAIAGKPHHWFCDVLCERFQCTPEEMVMVGDRIGTDMRFAHNCGMRSMLVLNGARMPVLDDFQPSVIVPHISQLMDEYWPRNLNW